VKIEDLSVLEVSVFLPEEVYAQVVPEKTRMRVQVGGSDLGVRPVAYKSPTVNPKLRTLEVKALVESPPPGVAPGCLAEVVVVLDGRSGVGIPTAAVAQRSGQAVVFLVENNTARMVTVKTGRDTNGWTEILEGGLKPGTAVVTMGQQLLNDGTSVSVVREAAR
jgi:multidrug efflux pump subunit AcrA (membrane-fusion protein)